MTGPPSSRLARGFRSVLALATCAMMALSWPLWVGASLYPRVPFVAPSPDLGYVVSWLLFGTLWVSTLAMVSERLWRGAAIVSLAMLSWLVLADQNRLQPWVYQYALTSVALLTANERWGLRLARVFLIAFYFHSGLSKLDYTFAHEMGPAFLRAGLDLVGVSAQKWSEANVARLSLLMPAFEILVSLLLMFGRTRRLGLVGVITIHSALLGILGPWGLGHSTIVLVWNGALILENLLLFGPRPGSAPVELFPQKRRRPAVAVLFAAVALLPFTERWGFWDTWPSFAVYASHNERSEVYVWTEDVARLPAVIRQHAYRADESRWSRVDLLGWSREERGVPNYPQSRTESAVGEWLATRFRLLHEVRVVHRGRADRLTGNRVTSITFGPGKPGSGTTGSGSTRIRPAAQSRRLAGASARRMRNDRRSYDLILSSWE